MADLDPGMAKLLADIEKSPLPRIWQLPITDESRGISGDGGSLTD